MSSEFDDLAGLLSADETEMWRLRAAEFSQMEAQRVSSGFGEAEEVAEEFDDPAIASLMGVSFLGLDDNSPSLFSRPIGSSIGSTVPPQMSQPLSFVSAADLEASMKPTLYAQAIESEMRKSGAPPPTATEKKPQQVLMSLATNSPVPFPPSWNPSMPPPPGCFVAYVDGPLVASLLSPAPPVSVPIPGSTAHLPAVAAIPPPAVAPTRSQLPGLLSNDAFKSTHEEFRRLLGELTDPTLLNDPLKLSGRVKRIQELHHSLAIHVEAINRIGNPQTAPFFLPPLPPMLSLDASTFSQLKPPTSNTQDAKSRGNQAPVSSSTSSSASKLSYAQRAGAVSSGPGLFAQSNASSGTTVAATAAKAGVSEDGKRTVLQPSEAVRRTPPQPLRPATLAALLSGPKPSSLGGKGMSRSDVISVNRYFFNSLAQRS